MNYQEDRQDSASSTIRILVSTDNHVGYLEKDPIRGNDSYTAFDEVITQARLNDVDMVILCGDLFHENKPSRRAMYQVMRTLRLNCFGEKPFELEILNDQSLLSKDLLFCHINVEDPEINVAIPVFSIHGNHDDPSGEDRLCALDILQISGLLNYFGRVPENDNIIVRPILLRKGNTKLALYGLSNVRDERLYRSFKQGNVRFMRPDVEQDTWFNLIAVHQNHTSHTETGYLPENFIPDFFDLVLWGHEHECAIDPAYNPQQNFYVIQPGSHIAILSITERSFTLEKIRLKSVRPFVMKDISLCENKLIRPNVNNKSMVTTFLMEKIQEAIEEALNEWKSFQEPYDIKEPPLPLIRLKVEYSLEYQVENPQRFSNRFVGKVANPNDVIKFYMKKNTRNKGNRMLHSDVEISNVKLENIKVEDLVKEFLNVQRLICLPEHELGEAITRFIEKDDREALKCFVTTHLDGQIKLLIKNQVTEENLEAELIKQKQLYEERTRLQHEDENKDTITNSFESLNNRSFLGNNCNENINIKQDSIFESNNSYKNISGIVKENDFIDNKDSASGYDDIIVPKVQNIQLKVYNIDENYSTRNLNRGKWKPQSAIYIDDDIDDSSDDEFVPRFGFKKPRLIQK
ncbi:hypothetical protein MERGE_002437 [Pneumocystis wakefieldiae]|uniref:Double-strand break repair protein n=1 Tax=Pneumocystis wakefieldiae TaxID=38082 RepID=A0A899FYQ9_9ASCO|nr:hypothetical protein MERGE_002437 [Pneumocystis wakefieldiae]